MPFATTASSGTAICCSVPKDIFGIYPFGRKVNGSLFRRMQRQISLFLIGKDAALQC